MAWRKKQLFWKEYSMLGRRLYPLGRLESRHSRPLLSCSLVVLCRLGLMLGEAGAEPGSLIVMEMIRIRQQRPDGSA